MSKLKINQNPLIKIRFDAYPSGVRKKLKQLRKLILESATELGLNEIEETLKWGEPSYIARRGSTIRIDWKERTPERYAMYLNCNTCLVETYRAVYGDLFKYEKNRAVVFKLEDKLPVEQVKDCICMALQYHKLKHKPFLGRI